MKKYDNIDQYIADQPLLVQQGLQQIRQIIKKNAPEAEEVISYGMPGFKYRGMLIWFAGAKKHYGLYPKTNAIKVFKNKLKDYKCSKGAIQFPLDNPVPLKLIGDIVKFRIKENIHDKELKEVNKIQKKKNKI